MGEVSVDWWAGKTLTLTQETIFTKIHSARSICSSSQHIIETFLEFGLCAPFDFKSINQSRYDRSVELALIQQFNKGIAVFV